MAIIDQTVITNFTQTKSNPAEVFFNNYYLTIPNVSLNENDAVFSYFQKITDNDEAATALTTAVLGTSASQGVDVMEVLDQFSRLNATQLNSYLCMFLNLNRVNTSFLGINNDPIKNPYVNRSILP